MVQTVGSKKEEVFLTLVTLAAGAGTAEAAAPKADPHSTGPSHVPHATDLSGTTFSSEWRSALSADNKGNPSLDLSKLDKPSPQPTPDLEQRFKERFPNLTSVWDGDTYLKKGSSGKQVEDLQKLLIAAGADINVDSDFGNKTEAAVRALQLRLGLKSDGLAGTGTVQAVFKAVISAEGIRTTPEAKPEVKPAPPQPQQHGVYSKEEIKGIQSALNKTLGFHLDIDGGLGKRTKFALAMYQVSRGLNATGEITNETISALASNKVQVDEFDYRLLPRSQQKGYIKGKEFTFAAISIGDFIMSEGTAKNFLEMFQAARTDGVTLEINSAFRTFEQQKKEYDAYIRDKNDLTKNEKDKAPLAAMPGHSNHQSGIALDIQTGGWKGKVYQWLEKFAAAFNFKRTVPSEPWHWEFRPEFRD